MISLARRLTAEALGTGLLVATVVGSGIMAERLTGDVALRLLCNSVATGAALVVLIALFAPVSGAQFNPVVTLLAALEGRLRAIEALLFTLAQIAGGITGTVLAHVMFGLAPVTMSTTVRSGAGQWLGEIVATFGLVLLISGSRRTTELPTAVLVGLYITAAYWFTSSTSFANPAVTIARAFTASFAGIAPGDVPAFVLAQVAGALLAAGLGNWLFSRDASA